MFTEWPIRLKFQPYYTNQTIVLPIIFLDTVDNEKKEYKSQ
jgi:hypothetical protein